MSIRLPYIPRRPDFCGDESCNLCFYTAEDPSILPQISEPGEVEYWPEAQPVAPPKESENLTHEMVEQIRRKAKVEVDAIIDKNFQETKASEASALLLQAVAKDQAKPSPQWQPVPVLTNNQVLDNIDVAGREKVKQEQLMAAEAKKKADAEAAKRKQELGFPGMSWMQRQREREYIEMIRREQERMFDVMRYRY